MALHANPGPRAMDLPSLLPLVLGFDPEVLHLNTPHTPNSLTYFSHLLSSLCQALDPILCPLKAGPGAGRKILPALEGWDPMSTSPGASPGPCLQSAASVLCPAPSRCTQNAFNLLHALLTSSSQHTHSHFAEKSEASHRQLPSSLPNPPNKCSLPEPPLLPTRREACPACLRWHSSLHAPSPSPKSRVSKILFPEFLFLPKILFPEFSTSPYGVIPSNT